MKARNLSTHGQASALAALYEEIHPTSNFFAIKNIIAETLKTNEYQDALAIINRGTKIQSSKQLSQLCAERKEERTF